MNSLGWLVNRSVEGVERLRDRGGGVTLCWSCSEHARPGRAREGQGYQRSGRRPIASTRAGGRSAPAAAVAERAGDGVEVLAVQLCADSPDFGRRDLQDPV